MKIPTYRSRASHAATVLNHVRWYGGLLAGIAILGTSSVQAANWVGGINSDWNNFANWSTPATGGSGTVSINSIPANVPTISANISPIPTTILVGLSAPGRVNHLAGNASVSAGSDLVLGRSTNGNGTYNLANTATTGGSLTGFGQGSGNLSIPYRVFVGGSVGAATGTLNIHTTGTLAVGTQLLVGNLGGTGTVKMDSGTLTVANTMEAGNATGSTGSFSMSSGTLAVGTQLLVGNLGGTGTLRMDSGTLTVVDAMEIGNGSGGNGTFSMFGGTVTKSGAGTAVTIGGGVTTDGGTGTANLNGGTFTAAGIFRVGQDLNTASVPVSNGIFNLGGTNLTVNGEFWIGNNTGANGTMNFSSGSLTTNSWTLVGRKDDTNAGAGATGTVTMTGGTWTKTSSESNFIVGDTGPGTMNMSGGLVIVTPHTAVDRGITWIGNRNSCTGTLTLSGTAEFRSPRFVMGVQTGTTGTLNLNGGTVKTAQIMGGVGTTAVNFNGTQLIATANSPAFIDKLSTANVAAGGLKVDTAGFNLSAPQIFGGTGGIVKTGAGTLALTGANNYSGNHTIAAGKLAVSVQSSTIGDFNVANGAAMGVIQETDTTLTLANVTMGTSGASSLDIDLGNSVGNPTVPALHVSGILTLNGPVTINVADLQPALGSFPLLSYATLQGGTSNFVLGDLPDGVFATLKSDVAGLVTLVVTSVSFPKWTGAVNGVWDTTTENWSDLLTFLPTRYANPVPVVFDDTATVNTAIILDTTVAPHKVTFDHSSAIYSLNGSGKITGGTGLTKSGSAGLTLNTTNDYTGVTTLSGGTTTVGMLASGGVASPLGAASASAANLVLNGGTLEYTGGNVTIDRGLTVSGLDSGISHASNLTLAGAVVSTTGGSFNKSGAGLLNLTHAAVTLGAAGQINEVLGGTLAFTGPGQTVSVVGELYVGSAPNVPGHLVIENSNLTVGAFIAVGRGNGDAGTVSTLTAANATVQVGNFSTGFNGGLATHDSDQSVTLSNTNWITNGITLLAESQNATTNLTLGGTSIYTAKDRIQMALNNTAVCNLIIQDSASLAHSGGWFSVGNDGTSTLTVKNNGSLSTTNGDFNISDVGTSTGTLNIQDNATVAATGVVFVGKNTGTTGTANMTGGTFNSVSWITIGRYSGATGTFNLSGGTVNQTDAGAGVIVGENGMGTLIVSGAATLNIDGGGLYLSAEGRGTSHSVAYLNGGTIIAKRVVQRDFNPMNYTEFHFNGGILRAHTGASLDFMSAHDLVVVDSGGAVIDSNAQTITIAQPLSGGGGLTKQGAGTLTLSGANTYTGTTTVSAGTLALTTACLDNTANVTLATGAVLNLTHSAIDQVGGLTIAGIPLAIGIYDATTHPGVITGTGKLQVTTTASPYAAWISGFPSIPLADRDPGDDPDHDGDSNAVEFALGGTPNNSGSRAKIFTLAADSNADTDATRELLMTIAVRVGTPAFAGNPSPVATLDGYTYTIQGATALTGFTTLATPVAVVVPPAPNANPPAGYEYRTFSLDGSNGLPAKGFLRVRLSY